MEKFLKFGLVGILNTVITIVVFNVLNMLLGESGEKYYIITNSIGYICGMVNSYIWNNKWVFKTNSSEISTIGKFIAVNAVVMLINNIILIGLVENMGVNTTIAQVAALVITTVLNFAGNKLWTFNK